MPALIKSRIQPNENGEDASEYWHGLFKLPQAIWLPIIAMTAVAIAAVSFNEWSVKNIRASSDRMAALEAMQNDLIELRSRLADAESGQRGYLLSADEQYLEPYNNALAILAVTSARMQDRASTDPSLLARAQRLEALRSRKVAELRETVILTQRGHRGDAIVVLRTGDGRIVMDEFRLEATGLLAELGSRVVSLRGDISHNAQRSRVTVAALALLTLMLLMTAIRLLVKDFWRQEQARQDQANERRRLEQVVGERTTELSDLTTHLQTVTEQEKADLARNLHDELAWLQGRASAKEPEVRGKLDALSSGLDEAMDVKRRVVENLRPALLDHFGLPTALHDHFDGTCRKAGLHCKVLIPEDFERIAQDVSIALFRVGQEALTNIIRHANAKNVELTLDSDADNYRITIADDGVGIDPAKSSGAISHGLVGMRHRIDALHGQFTITANRPQGTRVVVTVPREELRNEAGLGL
jgi:signal transduction histidine kinase